MLDIKYIRENKEKVQIAAKNKGREVDIDKIISLDDQRIALQQEIDNLRRLRNENAKERKVEEGKKLKEQISLKEADLKKTEEELKNLMLTVPNVPLDGVPIGKDSSGNIEVRKVGEPPKLDFTPKDHIELGKSLDIIDTERGSKVAGFRGYFLKNEGALLEMAVLWYAMKKLVSKGMTPFIPPVLVKEFALFGNGQFPWGREEVYNLEKDEVFLAGTAEVPLCAYHADETFNESDLPKKYAGYSACFRREAGSYGKDTKGIYRLHQFNKIEQVIFCKNDINESLKWHDWLLNNSEEILKDLKLPYRVMLMCTGDMGEPQIKKYDIETWMPSRNSYGETQSDSIMGEFQARRLNIRYRTKDGQSKFVHMLNNTAIASPRILIPILENYQQKDGSVIIPEVLREYVGKEIITPK